MQNKITYKLNKLLTRKDKNIVGVLLLLSFVLSIIETIGISAIMPFISMSSNPELIETNKYYKSLYDFFHFTSTNDFIFSLGIALIFFYFFRGFYTVFHGYLMNKFSMNKYKEFADSLYKVYLELPYSSFVNKNSSTMSKIIITEASQLAFLIQSLLVFLSELIVIIMLYIILLMVDIQMTLVLTILIGLKVFFLMKIVTKRIKNKGNDRATLQDKLYRIISETLRNFKVIKFISNQVMLLNEFKKISAKYSKVYISTNTLQLVPRSVLEALGLSMIMAIVIYIVKYDNNAANVIPIISMYALALYRILPAVTRIVGSYNTIAFYIPTVDLVYDDLHIQYRNESDKEIVFNDTISLCNVTFFYTSANRIINNINLELKKNSKIAFIGQSGSGKSTLVDLICGLHSPTDGKILIDGILLNNSNILDWRKKIGYIPQDIYLFDGTIGENISFGRDYNEKKVIKVLKQTNMYELIMSKDGLDTKVGEAGVQLSGGQKQRIGIARALYGDPEILVLDEATSALDMETEKNIMDEIYKISKDKTLIIIAHRLSTIDKCDIKIDMERI